MCLKHGPLDERAPHPLSVDTETPWLCRRCKSGKLCMAHVDQGPVISTLEVDFRLFLNAVVDNHV